MKRNLLLTPGPTQVPPELCAALGRPIIHHRTPQFQEYLKEAVSGLGYLLQTHNPVYLLAASGTGAMEACVVSLFSPGEKVLTVEGGKFGERWTELSRAWGLKPQVVTVEWGKAIDPARIAEALKADPDIQGVFVTLSETSTGVDTDIEAVGRIVKDTPALLVVDAVSGLGVTDFKTDVWHVDAAASASHKGLMLPPGVGIVSLSPKAQRRMALAKCPCYYLDLKKYKNAADKTDTPFTPAIGIIIALVEGLRMIREAGLENRLRHYARLAAAVCEAARALNMELLAHASCRSNVLTAIRVPEGIDGGRLVKTMRDVHGITIAGGQDSLKGRIIRIAHMGCLDEYDLLAGLSCLEKVLRQMGHVFPQGAGIAAAQKTLNP